MSVEDKKKDCKHENAWFSRCIEMCEHGEEGMHYYCEDCGSCADQHGVSDE